MTVLVRPAPTRVAGNRVVPFRQVQYTNKVRPVALKDWKPPVPEPLQPAPLLGLGTLAVLGLQALAYAWGQLNSRPSTSTYQPEVPNAPPILGTVPPSGNTVGAPLRIVRSAGTYNGFFLFPERVDFSGPIGASDFVLPDVLSVQGVAGARLENGNYAIGLFIRTTTNEQYIDGTQVGTNGTLEGYTPQYTLTWDNAGAVPFPNVYAGPPLPEAYLAPRVEPEPAPIVAPPVPLPLPLPLPSTVPQVVPSTEPEPVPLVPITPGPVAPPIVQPATPVSPVQPKVPATTGISNGRVIAPAPVPVATTPKDAIFPVPGGLPVTGKTAVGTIQGVAAEVGRIEQKIDRMLNPDPFQWGDVPAKGDLLADAIKAIVEALVALTSGTIYKLDSPCEIDEETGDKKDPIEVEAPGALTSFGTILNRIDAIAELLQVHKDLKQPNCHIPPVAVGGEFVTVNFEQID